MTEAEGYWYGSNYGRGITVFDVRPARTTSTDQIAFGFMTWNETGTLLRVDGDRSAAHFVDARLVIIYLLSFRNLRLHDEWWGTGVVICLERDADLHMAKLMPLPLTVSCFSKIQIGFTFLAPAHLGSPRKRAVKRVCVCV